MSDAPEAASPDLDRELHREALDALTDRQKWDDKQSLADDMRHDGVRRKNKPWPTASDVHYPLADMSITKLKPYYFTQAFGNEHLCDFTAQSRTLLDFREAAARWFDFQLKQRSNFEKALTIAVDRAAERGRTPVRVWWDARRKQVRFDALRPTDFIVPVASRDDLEDADWIVHVQVFSVAAYKRLGAPFNTSPEFIRAIAGKGAATNDSQAVARDKEFSRDGITRGRNDNEIVLWTRYTPPAEGSGLGWKVRTYSPTQPDRPVRPDFHLPYNRGVFAGERPIPPFAALTFELKEDRWYAPRGVCEMLAPFEAGLNKDWNTLNDWKSLTCQPLFYSEKPLPNTGNLTPRPGQIMPFPLSAVQFPDMPVDIYRGMADTRGTAEQLLAVPDFGQVSQKNPGGNKTATEISAIAATQGQGVDMRSRIFRRELGLIYRMAWSLLVQYADRALDYVYQDELADLPPDALSDKWLIEPSGSGDSMPREARVQRAYGRMNMLKGNPFVRQDELVKATLAEDDPRLVRTLFINPDQLAATQQEDQAQELTVLMMGFPAEVRPTDDHFTHLVTLGQFLESRMGLAMLAQVGAAQNPVPLGQLAGHGLQHAAAMEKAKDARLRQLAPLVQQLQAALQTAQQAQARLAQQQNPAAQPAAPEPQQ